MAKAGYPVKTIWTLQSQYDRYPGALPVIMEHLEKGGYPGTVMGMLARLMGVKDARPYWGRVRHLYQTHPDEPQLADALGRMAGKEQFGDLVELLLDDSRDGMRIMVIPDIIRVGRERGWKAIESVADDPVLRPEAGYRLHQRELRRRAKARKQGHT